MENGYKEEIEKLLKDTDDINICFTYFEYAFEIRRLKRENDNLTAENNDKIEKLQTEMESVEFKMMEDAFKKTGDDDAVITSLKFEKMWKKLDSDIESLNPEWRDEIWEMMKNIKGEFLK